MAASLKDIAGWFQDGLEQHAAYMIIVCDTFDHEDYPHYVTKAEASNFWSHYYYYDDKNMQRIMEVYDLQKPWSQQSQGRVMNTPPRPSPTTVMGVE